MQAEESLAKSTRLHVAARSLSGLGTARTASTVLSAILSSPVRNLRERFPCMYADPHPHPCRLLSEMFPKRSEYVPTILTPARAPQFGHIPGGVYRFPLCHDFSPTRYLTPVVSTFQPPTFAALAV